MLKTLQAISEKAILFNDVDFKHKQVGSKWIGFPGASPEDILVAEERLNIKLPDDYCEFLKISNGFPPTSTISCNFLPIEKIDYLRVLDEDLVEIWNSHGLKEVAEGLASSILVGGLNEEQSFLLIPPKTKEGKWSYWKFATWIPGEEIYESLESYLKEDLSFLESETEGLTEPRPRFVTDYSLRDAVFSLRWSEVFSIASKFILENTNYHYFNGEADLFSLLLLSSGKQNRFEDFEQFTRELKIRRGPDVYTAGVNRDFLLNKYEAAAKKREFFVEDLQRNKFVSNDSPMRVNDIDRQIAEVRTDLLKEKNKLAKVDYQLYFLFEYGDAKDFVDLYESNQNEFFLNAHLNAAIVYVTIGQTGNAKAALKRYFKHSFDYRPFEPFLNEVLLPLIDKELIDSYFN